MNLYNGLRKVQSNVTYVLPFLNITQKSHIVKLNNKLNINHINTQFLIIFNHINMEEDMNLELMC